MADLDPQLLQKLKPLIAKDAPILAGMLDGPSAAVALSLLGKALVGDAQAAIGDVVTTAQANTSDVHLKIAAAEQQGQMRLRQSQSNNDVSLAQLDPVVAQTLLQESTKQQQAVLGDVQDARKRSIERHDKTNQRLAYAVTVLFFGLIITLIFHGLPTPQSDGARDILLTLLGVVATGWTAIISFYFGSSTGSMQKSLTLDAIVQKQGAPQPPNTPA